MTEKASVNTDRELWREREDDPYADSIHVTTQGAIGMNVGGYVVVMLIREWMRAARRERQLAQMVRSLAHYFHPEISRGPASPRWVVTARELLECDVLSAESAMEVREYLRVDGVDGGEVGDARN